MNVDDVASFVLPGRWWALPTTGPETQLLARVKRHVERAVGTADDRATLRREVRTQLLDAARAAREMGADHVYLAEQLADGVPFPATLLVVRAGERQRLHGTVAERAQALLAVLPADKTPAVVDSVAFPLARNVEVGSTALPQSADEYEGGVKVHYWLASPLTGELMLFAFSCPLIALHEQVVDLFDAIMSTVRFPEPAVTA